MSVYYSLKKQFTGYRNTWTVVRSTGPAGPTMAWCMGANQRRYLWGLGVTTFVNVAR